jgi:regulator of protease activity HflC (stomatin/prohibitin superfamily)
MNLIQLISGLTGLTGLAIVVSVGFGSIVPVQEGTVHATYKFGQAQEQILTPGLNIVMPFVTSTKQLDVSTKSIPEKFTGLTSDGQLVNVTATANYNINGAHAAQTARLIILTGDKDKDIETIKNVSLQPTLLAVVKQVIAKYPISYIIANQAAIADEIEAGINTTLKTQSVVTLQNFVVTGLVLDPEVQQAIELKAIAIQKQQQAEIDLKTAETIAKNNEIISKSLTPVLLQDAAIKKWNGNSSVFTVGGSTNSTPVIVNTPTTK